MRLFPKFLSLIFLLNCIFLLGFAQQKDAPPANWQHLDLQQNGVLGMGTDKAYELLKNKSSKPVIVAVIDGGIDTAHVDLKSILWRNEQEIAGNGVDDDKNGFVDDVHGWNFIGSTKGNVQYDNMELVRWVRKLQPKYETALNSTLFSSAERKEFEFYQGLVTDYMAQLEQAKSTLSSVTYFRQILGDILSKITAKTPNLPDFERYKPVSDSEEQVLKAVKDALKDDADFSKFMKELEEVYTSCTAKVLYQLNLEYDPRSIVGDDYTNASQHVYGNADVMGPDAEHGTHVAGIIGAIRTNDLGIKGVADKVQIMAIRVVPDGDERDKDVANAIRYAVDNGAKVINMSFGKPYAWNKQVVDDAVRYAQSKDVLLVHAAGNDAKNIDVAKNYPTRFYSDSTGLLTGKADNWIEVGASSWKNDESLVAEFSNFGKKNVDVFAPGVKINSTVPHGAYEDNDGTSMAAPMVSGLAALLRSYFPEFSALQVKALILKSVYKVPQKVKVAEDGHSVRVSFTDVCISGGVVNAYTTVLEALKGQR
ncbi:MAG: S8 family peptidase [Sphingobacteriaceae bacterium]|nr:S8 family peptidase [Sphingobacteriaceae bacterium]